MDWLVALLAQIFGIGLDKVVDLANREDTVQDAEPELEAMVDLDPVPDDLSRFDQLFDADEDSLC